MSKRTSQTGRRRIQDRLDANRSEGERLLENQELMAEVKRLQREYGLPFGSDAESKRYWEVLTNDGKVETETGQVALGPAFDRHAKLINQLRLLFTKYALPDRLYDALWGLVFLGRPGVQYGGGAFPAAPFPKYGERETPHLLIYPDTDIDNPMVLQYIRDWQASRREQPPGPKTIPGSRKVDWRPVWEWHKRHPDVTLRQLAKAISRDPSYVRRQMSLLEEELAARNK